LTPYGSGHQRRGFLPLEDSMRCLALTLDHPPARGEYRVFNQFQEVYSVLELAKKVQRAGRAAGLDVTIRPLENPRLEPEDHHYNPDHRHLRDLGYRPTTDVDAAIRAMLADLAPYRDRIEAYRQVFVPDIRWNLARAKVGPRAVLEDEVTSS